MEIVKTLGSFEGHEEGHMQILDTIMYDGAWWLVASWLSRTNAKVHPERIIKLGGPKTHFQEATGQPFRFVLTNAIPHTLYRGTPHVGYEMIIHPAAASADGPASIH